MYSMDPELEFLFNIVHKFELEIVSKVRTRFSSCPYNYLFS